MAGPCLPHTRRVRGRLPDVLHSRERPGFLRTGSSQPMTFAAPLWLLGLLPLGGVIVYLLWGRRRQEAVPFLDLWLGPVKGPRPKRRIAAPPLALALAILAMLLAILGAARPALRDPTASAPISIIVDNGVTMSA